MTINFSSGDVVGVVELGAEPGVYADKVVPIDAEILDVGLSKGVVQIIYGTKQRTERKKEKKFLIHVLGQPLPKRDFNYYWYLGTILRKGWCVFEVI